MGLPKKLTEQQIKFANLLISEQGRMTATACAIELVALTLSSAIERMKLC